MDEVDDCIEEIIELLENKRDQLKQELANRIEERDKARETFSKLPSAPFWKKPFKPRLEKLLRRKLRGLKREIPALEEKVEHYEGGLVHLEQGIYGSAMPLLKKLAFVACLGSVRGTKCREILKLIEQFTALNSNPCGS